MKRNTDTHSKDERKKEKIFESIVVNYCKYFKGNIVVERVKKENH
jgi:hypothetical protein